MEENDIISDKRLLVVDDEPDILETIEELLDVCRLDTAGDFETARALLQRNPYDLAILDIMGVRGNDLLAIAVSKEIPTIMMTAHALGVDAFVESMTTGADIFMPKDELADIRLYVADTLSAHQQDGQKPRKWFARIKPFFDRKFGPDWLKGTKRLWI